MVAEPFKLKHAEINSSMRNLKERVVSAIVISSGPVYSIAKDESGEEYHVAGNSGPVSFVIGDHGIEVIDPHTITSPPEGEQVCLVLALAQDPDKPRKLASLWGNLINWLEVTRGSEHYRFVDHKGRVIKQGTLRSFLKIPRSSWDYSRRDPYARQHIFTLKVGNKSMDIDQFGHWELWDWETKSYNRCEDPRPIDHNLEVQQKLAA